MKATNAPKIDEGGVPVTAISDVTPRRLGITHKGAAKIELHLSARAFADIVVIILLGLLSATMFWGSNGQRYSKEAQKRCASACVKYGAVWGEQVATSSKAVACKCWRNAGRAPFEMIAGKE